MPTFDLGKFKLTPKGVYDSSTAYEALDVVTYNFSSYLVLQNVQGITPTDDNTNYQLLSQGVDPSDISDKKSVISALSAFIDENGDSQKVLVVSFIGYNSSGNLSLINLDIVIENITSSPIYLYRDTSNVWQLSTTSPSTGYSVTPIYIGSIKTKTVNGSTTKTFFINDDETQFDELNNNKVDKKTWSTLLTATTTEDAVFQLDDTSAGVDLNSYSEIEVIIELPSKVTAFLHNFWKYNNTYSIKVLGSLSSMEMRYIVVKVKKEYGIWWIENTLGIQYDRLATHWKTVYRQGTNNVVFSSFEGMRFALSTTNVLPTGTNVRVRGLK